MKKLLLSLLALTLAVAANAQFKDLQLDKDMKWSARAGFSFNSTTIGLDASSVKIKPGGTVGFYIGAVNNMTLSDKLGLQTELIFRTSGMKVSAEEDTTTSLDYGSSFDASIPNGDYIPGKQKVSYHTNMFDISILFKSNTAEKINLLAGPTLSFRLGSSVKFNKGIEEVAENTGMGSAFLDEVSEIANEVANEAVKAFNIGLALGAEYQITDQIFVDARYNIGLVNLMKNKIDMSKIKIDGQSMWHGEINIKDTAGVVPTIKARYFQIGVGYRF